MDPITIMALVGGGLQLFGGMEQSKQRAWELEDEAINATRNAKMAREAGRFNAERQQLESNQIIGRAVTDFGASGIEMDSGNVLEVLRQSAINSELDRQTILRGSELEARQYEARARSAGIGAANTKKAGTIGAFAQMFNTGANVMGKTGGGSGNGKIAQDSGPGYVSDSSQFRSGNLRIDSRVAG